MPLRKTPKLNLAFLLFLDDDEPHKISEVVEHLAKHFKLTKKEIELKKQSGYETLFHNRVHWEKYNLKLGGYVQDVEKGIISITTKGKQLLEINPEK